jgi:purine-binding chemotaxis protein CheW
MNASAHAIHEDQHLQQMLTFALDTESYGVDIQRVQEIRGWTPVTAIPEAPPHILGVLNLRGAIVPIIDLRARIGMSPMTPSATTVIIVLNVETAQGTRLFGIVVDRVSDVANISESNLKPVPTMGQYGTADYLRGLVNNCESMVVLLDIDRLLGGNGESY